MNSSEWTQHIILRSLCIDKRKNINEKVLAEISEKNFTSTPYKKAIRRIQSYFSKKGRILTWKELINDPTLKEDIRSRIKAAEVKRKKIKKHDNSLKLPSKYDEYKNIVQNLYSDSKHKSMISLQNQLTEDLKSDYLTSDQVDEILNKVSNKIDEAKRLENTAGTIIRLERDNIKEYIADFKQQIKNRFFFPTGIKAFDSRNIGIPKDSYFLIAAKSGAGKSSLALQLAMNMKKVGGRICFVHAEMSREELLLRMASNLLEVPMNHIVADIDKYEKKIIKQLRSFFKVEQNDASCFDLYPPEPDETLEHVLLNCKHYKYDAVFVDYINLLSPMGGEDGWKALDMAGRYAKMFATTNSTIVSLLAQLDETTNNVRYSRALREHAHNAWFWRETKDEINDLGYITVRQEKSRNQDPRPFKIGADLSISKFSDYDENDFKEAKKGNKSTEKLDKNFDDVPSSKDV